jgi:peptidoglycan biosynthesis protein MviN/MurJ (putative lipid II flippase)
MVTEHHLPLRALHLGGVASMFALGLAGFSLFYVLLRSYYAQENTKTPFMINLGLMRST